MAPMTALNKVKAPIFKGRVSGVYGVAITNKDDPMVAAKHVTMAYQNTRKCSEMCIHVHPLQATINLKLQAYTLHKNVHVASILQCGTRYILKAPPRPLYIQLQPNITTTISIVIQKSRYDIPHKI